MARPKKPDSERKKNPRGVRLKQEDLDFVIFVGKGSFQAGIDWLVKIARSNANIFIRKQKLKELEK